jgi:uncharacterized protein with gpF-like domain
MSDEQSGVVTLKVRVSPEFREKIVNTAKQNNRSMNQEIVARLEKSFEDSYIDTVSDAVIAELLEGTVNKMLSAMKKQGVSEDKIHNALVDLTNKKAP